MKLIPNLLIKVGKNAMLGLGGIVSIACLGLGLYGVNYANQNKQFINQLVLESKTGIENFKQQTQVIDDSIQSGSLQANIEEVKSKVIKFLEDSKAGIKTQIDNLYSSINTINGLDLNETDKQNIVNALNFLIKNLENFSQSIPNIQNQIENAVDITQIQNILTTTMNSINKITDSTIQVLNKVTPEKVDVYYDNISLTLLAIGSISFLLILIGSSLSFIFYKHIDGKMVNRFTKKRELEKHLRIILNKHPEIIDKIKVKR